MYSCGSSSPDIGFYKLPPIITTEADREFLNEVNEFIDAELGKINYLDEEQRYLVFKTVFNKVIEHVTAYKPVLVQIKKEYEDTIDTIKKGQREATFLQEKLKAMASEPSTLRNYRKRSDELEERISMLRKKNDKIQQELDQIRLTKEEKEKRPKTEEKPERELKKDSRLIPGLSIEESTDMKVLQKKYDLLDRQLKELSLSLRARFLPKTHKLQLKESLDNKVTNRDQLLWQSQVYKARGQRLKIALEAAQAYNQMKPPHQTVGDAVTIAFQQASGILKAEREKTDGEQNDAAQTTTFEDDDPNKEKEAEMMLEYIEKFNELFEDGLYEEAAVHAANSPKGILRTQATLAKFRDVKVKTKGRSPLLAFCDSIMSSVKAAGSKPNEGLSTDCMDACLNENRLDLAYHWLSQDRLTQSVALGKLISQHCSCPLPCKCGCQSLAQSVFNKLKCHQDIIITLLKQGKFQAALQYGRLRQCIYDSNISEILSEVCSENFVNGLMEADLNGNRCFLELNSGTLLLTLVNLKQTEMVSCLVQDMLKPASMDTDATTCLMSLQTAIVLDTVTSCTQWMTIIEALGNDGFEESMLQLLAMTFVVEVVQQAWKVEKEEKKGVSFSMDASEVDLQQDEDDEEDDDDDKLEANTKESSIELSSRSRETTSLDHSSRETSPEVTKCKVVKESILKKTSEKPLQKDDVSTPEITPRKSPLKRRTVKISEPNDDDDDDDDDYYYETDDGEESDDSDDDDVGKKAVKVLTMSNEGVREKRKKGFKFGQDDDKNNENGPEDTEVVDDRKETVSESNTMAESWDKKIEVKFKEIGESNVDSTININESKLSKKMELVVEDDDMMGGNSKTETGDDEKLGVKFAEMEEIKDKTELSDNIELVDELVTENSQSESRNNEKIGVKFAEMEELKEDDSSTEMIDLVRENKNDVAVILESESRDDVKIRVKFAEVKEVNEELSMEVNVTELNEKIDLFETGEKEGEGEAKPKVMFADDTGCDEEMPEALKVELSLINDPEREDETEC